MINILIQGNSGLIFSFAFEIQLWM